VLAWLYVLARCRFAYGPAYNTATDCLLLQEIQIDFGFTFLVPAHPASARHNPDSCKTVVVVVVAVAVAVVVVLLYCSICYSSFLGLYSCFYHC